MRQSRNIPFCLETYQFFHGERADYCVYANGTITRTWKKSMIEEIVKPYMHKGKLTVHVSGKNFIVKHVVAAAFLPNYRKGCSVVCVDRDETNCGEDNLCVISKRALGRITGWMSKSQKIEILRPGERAYKKYRSIREAAKSLNCSYQTLLDYVNKKNKSSVLDGIKVRVI